MVAVEQFDLNVKTQKRVATLLFLEEHVVIFFPCLAVNFCIAMKTMQHTKLPTRVIHIEHCNGHKKMCCNGCYSTRNAQRKTQVPDPCKCPEKKGRKTILQYYYELINFI